MTIKMIVMAAVNTSEQLQGYAVCTQDFFKQWEQGDDDKYPDMYSLFWGQHDEVTSWSEWGGVMQYVTESEGEIVAVYPCFAY